MMDFDNELFICFASRPSSSSSSSSMKISSKPIISPGRTDKLREPTTTIALSSSLSRRLRSNGSMRGGQSSPMFPTGNKKRGCAFENPEPSSPKVTCIGQVRVKSKKQGKKMGARSRSSRDSSFRKTEHQEEGILAQKSEQECLPHRNQRWVHLPLSICEALRGFGAEFNCFLPCGGRSTCSSTNEREKEEKRRTTTSSCGAVFARWLMALQDGEEEKRREMALVVGEEERRREKRADLFGEIEIEIEEEKGESKGEVEDEEERVSICIPPRNALLLMRCRSEPLRMSALANRLWDSSNTTIEDDEEEDSEDEEEEREEDDISVAEAVEKSQKEENPEDLLKEEEQVNTVKEEQQEEQEVELKEEEMLNGSSFEAVNQLENTEIKEKEEPKLEDKLVEKDEKRSSSSSSSSLEEEEIILNGSSFESLDQHENPELEEEEEESILLKEAEILEEKEERRASFSSSTSYCEVSVQFEGVSVAVASDERVEEKSTEEEKETQERDSEVEAIETQEKSSTITEQDIHVEKSKARESQDEEEHELPNCLLLMMYEPKLSMEVSKETWVCKTDFIRSRPDKKVVLINGRDEWKNRVSTDFNPAPPQQRSRSSCSNPAQVMGPPSMATMIEQKLVNAVAYEPFVLTRCKSEPLRSSAKLVPDPSCFWINQKLEPHRLGVGATGVGL